MAKNSTRSKIKYQAEKADECLNACASHLMQLDLIADERSELITQVLPSIVVGLTEVQKALQSFTKLL